MKSLLLLLFLLSIGINLSAQKEAQVSSKSEVEIRWDSLNAKMEKYFYAGNYDLAVEYGREAYTWALTNFETSNVIIGNSLDNLGVVLHHAGKLGEAQPILEKGLEHAKKYLPKESEDRLVRSNNLAMLYKDLGLYERAIPLFSEILILAEKSLGKEHLYYGIFLNNQALVYWEMNQYERAMENHKEALLLTEKVLGKKHRKYAIRLSNLASDYRDLQQYDKALPLFLEALEVEEITIGKRHPARAMTLVNTGTLYSLMGQKEKAITYLKEGVSIAEEKLGKEHFNYLLYLQELANIYMHLGRYGESLPLYQEIFQKRQKKLGNTHRTTLATLENMATLYEVMGETEKSAESYKKVNSYINQRINQVYKYFSETEQLAISIDNQGADNAIQSFAIRHPNEYDLTNFIFDKILTTKGLVLRNKEQMLKTLRKNGNEDTQSALVKWEALKKIMAEQYSLPVNNRSIQFDSLKRKASEVESELARISLEFQEAQKEIYWKDVQKVLKKGEVAIEFSQFHYVENNQPTDSIFYVAYLLKEGTSKVKMLYLFEEKELGKLKNLRSLYAAKSKNGQASLRDLIFEPLAAELRDIHTIYYTSSGLLHRVNLNAIEYRTGEILADHFELHKLSSTRELAIRSQKSAYTQKSAALFGGIDYEKGEIVLNEDLNITNFDNALGDDFRTFRGDDWEYLQWTEKEVEGARESLEKSDFVVDLKKRQQATEEQFKILDKNKPSPKVLHLATHAYFFPKSVSNNKKINAFKSAKQPMIRSGLILAGANEAWKGDGRLGKKEDGILTAYEIAQMDLSNTELVILSACDTGLGDIEGSEGVFGLQRAFKLAGVQHIIMTLWPVKDKQTQEFMTNFDKEWLEKEKSISEAFRQVQRNMKNQYAKPFNPSLWAGFILIE